MNENRLVRIRQEGEPVTRAVRARDEMNLAEFPLSAIADRTDPSQKTLRFEDQTWDPSRDVMVTRRLTITASDEYGLPTATDDEVILGLIQLSLQRNFVERKVPFTRYQLIEVLGWRQEGKSYERLEQSLNRWVGVTLYYENAWWDKEHQSWVDEKFHLIDNFKLYDRERTRERRAGHQRVLPLSTFTWNDVLFRSFTAGNLKSIDFEFCKSLASSIAKRLYRFLDKRFYHRKRWDFDLKEVSWEHIGLSRSYDTGNLKRKLRPAIDELVEKGFLEPMEDADRFVRVCAGEWRIIFQHARRTQKVAAPALNDQQAELVVALTERGVTPSIAEQTVTKFSRERIATQLEAFDWRMRQKDARLSRNPAGFLISSIRSDYVPPPTFTSRAEKAKRDAELAERKRQAEEKALAEQKREAEKVRAKTDTANEFWQSLSAPERERMEAEALASAPPLKRELVAKGGSFARATKRSILDEFALRQIRTAA